MEYAPLAIKVLDVTPLSVDIDPAKDENSSDADSLDGNDEETALDIPTKSSPASSEPLLQFTPKQMQLFQTRYEHGHVSRT